MSRTLATDSWSSTSLECWRRDPSLSVIVYWGGLKIWEKAMLVYLFVNYLFQESEFFNTMNNLETAARNYLKFILELHLKFRETA